MITMSREEEEEDQVAPLLLPKTYLIKKCYSPRAIWVLIRSHLKCFRRLNKSTILLCDGNTVVYSFHSTHETSLTILLQFMLENGIPNANQMNPEARRILTDAILMSRVPQKALRNAFRAKNGHCHGMTKDDTEILSNEGVLPILKAFGFRFSMFGDRIYAPPGTALPNKKYYFATLEDVREFIRALPDLPHEPDHIDDLHYCKQSLLLRIWAAKSTRPLPVFDWSKFRRGSTQWSDDTSSVCSVLTDEGGARKETIKHAICSRIVPSCPIQDSILSSSKGRCNPGRAAPNCTTANTVLTVRQCAPLNVREEAYLLCNPLPTAKELREAVCHPQNDDQFSEGDGEDFDDDATLPTSNSIAESAVNDESSFVYSVNLLEDDEDVAFAFQDSCRLPSCSLPARTSKPPIPLDVSYEKRKEGKCDSVATNIKPNPLVGWTSADASFKPTMKDEKQSSRIVAPEKKCLYSPLPTILKKSDQVQVPRSVTPEKKRMDSPMPLKEKKTEEKQSSRIVTPEKKRASSPSPIGRYRSLLDNIPEEHSICSSDVQETSRFDSFYSDDDEYTVNEPAEDKESFIYQFLDATVIPTFEYIETFSPKCSAPISGVNSMFAAPASCTCTNVTTVSEINPEKEKSKTENSRKSSTTISKTQEPLARAELVTLTFPPPADDNVEHWTIEQLQAKNEEISQALAIYNAENMPSSKLQETNKSLKAGVEYLKRKLLINEYEALKAEYERLKAEHEQVEQQDLTH